MWQSIREKLRSLSGGQAGREAPLAGAPGSRRQKTYSADSGYVYLYYFEGFRDTSPAWEYVFTVTADRKTWFPVTVVVDRRTLGLWAKDEGRDLTASERFAVAKVALRRAFDLREDPAGMREPVRIDAVEMRAIAEVLDLL